MNCMKCGREVENEQAFCEDCLVDMEKYPVPPGTAVHLHLRREAPVIRRQPRRRKLTPSEQVPILKRRIRVLTIALAVAVLLFLASLYPAVNYFIRHYNLRPGQNYTAITTVSPETSQPAAAD